MDDLTDKAKVEAPNAKGKVARPKAKTADVTVFRGSPPAIPGAGTKRPEAKVKLGVRLRPLVVLGLLALLGFVAYRISTVTRAPRGGEQTAQPAVAIATAGTGDIRVVVNALGTVTPIATVTVKSQVNGQLLSVGFKEGQSIKKGDFLAQIDPRPFEALKDQLEGQLARDQGLLDQARKNLLRYQTLLKQDSIARQQAEDQGFLVRQTEGSIRSDQAQIDAQKLNLIYAHIVSPIDGRIGLRMVDPGNYVQTSDAGLAVVTQMHPISVIFVVPEDDIPPIMDAIHQGTTLEVTAYDRTNVTALSSGKVVSLDSQIDPTTGTVKLRADFDNLDDKLFPNQFVNARLLIKTLHGATTVPSRAVQYGTPGAYVYVLGADDKVSVRAVELGPQDGAMIAIKSGLAPRDRIVVDGADRLRDGTKVSIAAVEGPASPQPSKGLPSGKQGSRPGDRP
jgi:membrane fusion protein, multidrug efflux system